MRNIYLISTVLLVIVSFIGCDQVTAPNSKPRGPVWVVYHSYNSQLLSDTINAIIIVNDTKWIATDKGANSISSVGWQKYTDSLRYATPVGLSRKVNAITVGKDRSVWFGLAGGGVVRLNLYNSVGGRWKRYTTPDLNTDYVYALAVDILGDIYVGTSNGLSRFIPDNSNINGGRWLRYGSGNSPLPDEPIRCASLNPYDNLVWFGTSSHGIVSFDSDFYWNIDTPSETPFPIVAMAFSRYNAIWFGTYADWAYHYSTTTYEWTHVADSASGGGLKGNFVNAVAIQYDGTVWFGTNKGLTQFNGTLWQTFTRESSLLPSDTVTSLSFDSKGNLWIGTPQGLAEYNAEGTIQ